MKKHQKLDLVKKFRPSETISRQNIASKIESLSDRRGRKIKKKKTKMPILDKLTLKRHSHARMIFLNKAKVSIQLWILKVKR